MKNLKKENGITLIALIITIIVLLILAGVSIAMVVGDNGVLGQAINATVATDVADTKEQIELAVIGYLDENGEYTISDVEQAVEDTGATLGSDGVTVTTAKGNEVDISDLVNGASVELISTEESYVGYYADVDGDGNVDGVIYADLCIGGNGTWGDYGHSAYSYDAIDNCKNYYISQESFEGAFGTKGVLKALGTGNDRFYVMALEDFSANGYTTFYWYYTAYSNQSLDNIASENDFGEGYTNTGNMITKWDAGENGGYGAQNERDIWGLIQDKYLKGWFVPSASEWAAFGDAFGINYDYKSFGLSKSYWTSSQASPSYAWYAYFMDNYINSDLVLDGYFIRLSVKF